MNENNRSRILIILKALTELSDVVNPISTNDLLAYCQNEGIKVIRQTLYSDINALKSYGFDIHYVAQKGYYLESNTLSLACAKVLYDLIDSSQTLSMSTKNELLTSINQFIKPKHVTLLKKYRISKPSSKQSTCSLKTISLLTNAISKQRYIQFYYFDADVKGNRLYRKNKASYHLLPYYIFIQNDRYYVIGYDHKHDSLVHYRLDKMDAIVIKEVSETTPKIDQVNSHLQTSIYLFTGENELVTLTIQSSLLSVFLDQFPALMLLKNNKDTVSIAISVQVNTSLFSWLTNFVPPKVIIDSPSNVKNNYKHYLESIINSY